jgi:hypothetical protein
MAMNWRRRRHPPRTAKVSEVTCPVCSEVYAGDRIACPACGVMKPEAPAAAEPAPAKPACEACGRPAPRRSPEERADAARVRAERASLRAREVAALEALAGPTLRLEGDPPVYHERVIPLDARTAAGREVLRLTRPNGSELVVSAKSYDGFMGGTARTYVFASIWFRGAAGHLYRSKGIGFELAELRAVAGALLALAAELEPEAGATAPVAVAGTVVKGAS